MRNFKSGIDVRITSYRNERIKMLNDMVRNFLWDDEAINQYVIGEFIIMNDQYMPYGSKPLAYNGQTFKIKKITKDIVEFIECYILTVSKDIDLIVPTEKGMPHYKKRISQLKHEAIESKSWNNYRDFKCQFADISYGYAVTNYRIQGSTVTGCYVDLSDILSVGPLSNKRKLQAFYVGISRPTDFLAIF